MSIAQRLVNLSDGLSAEGILSAAKGGTGTTTGAGSSTPTISSINYGGDDTATNPAGGATITLTGTNFAAGAKVLINTTPVSVVTVVSQTQITFTAPQLAPGSYILYVVNLDGSTAIAVPGIQVSGTPAWTTAAGSLGTSYETAPVSTTVAATSDSAVTYSVVSGTLPSGVTINASGTISGTSPAVGGSTTYTFTVRATDSELQDTDRQFSLTINPDVVTWSSSNTIGLEQNASSTTALAATSAAGQTVSYAVDTLPAGLTLSGAIVSGTPTATGTTTTVATATAAVTGKTAQQTITWTVSIAADAYWKYTTLLLNGENSAKPFLADASTNNFALTAYGDTKPSNFGPYTPGYYSVALDSQRHLSTPANTAFDFGSDDFTVEAWVYFKTYNSMQYSGHTIATNYENNNGWNFGFGGQNSIDGLGISTYSGNNLATSVSATGVNSSVVPLNKWHHVAVTKSGSTVRIFVNGVGYATSGTYTAVGAGGRFAVGVYQQNMTYSGNPNWNISNLRVVKGTAVYTADFTPPTSPLTAVTGTSLLACQGNRFVDSSTNAFPLTASSSSNISVSGFVPFVPNSSYSTRGSTYFDGSGDNLQVPYSSTLAATTGAYSIETWVYFSGSGDNQGVIGTTSDGFCGFERSAGNWAYYFGTSGTGTGVAAALNQWNHVVICRNISGAGAFFVNGTRLATFTDTANKTGFGNLQIGYNGVAGGAYTTGYIADYRYVKGNPYDPTLTSLTVPTSPLTTIPNTQVLTLQTNQPHTNSQFLDNSTSALTITRTGNATQGSFSPYGANWSTYFDGSGDYLSVANNAAFNQNTAFTVECWVYATLGGYFYAQLTNGFLCLNYDGSTRQIKVDRSYVGVQITSTNSFAFNQWHHVAMSYDGTTTRLFVNGALEGSVAGGGAASGTDTQIGAYAGANNFNGYISNFRVTNAALYTSAFTPSTQPLTALSTTKFLTCQQANSVDSSMSALAITRVGDVSIQKFSPFASVTQTPQSHSVYFDGSGDSLTYTGGTTTTLSGDFTLECWVYLNNLSANQPIICIGDDYNLGALFYIDTAGKLGLFANNVQVLLSAGTVTTNSWNHVAYVRSGTTTTAYLNGVSKGTGTSSSQWSGTTTYIGKEVYNTGTGIQLSGYLSNLRLVKGTALYTANFTPPTAPLTAITNTSLLTCQDATIRDNSTNAFTITANGDVRPRQQNPFGYTTSSAQDYTPSVFGGSAYFDGTGDYLTIPDSALTEPRSNNFTLECWYYMNAAGGYLIGKRNPASANYGIFQIAVNTSGGSVLGVLEGGSPWNLSLNFTATTPLYTWNHLAFVRLGDDYTVYINGVRSGTTTLLYALNNSNYDWVVGAYQSDGTGAFNGYITDMRFVNGTALYTSNFVPPAQPLQAVPNTTLLLNMDRAAITDKSGKVVAETVGDVKVSTSVKKYGTSSLYFDGAGDYMLIGPSPNLEFGAGDFTIEFWFYRTGTGRMALYSGSWGTDFSIGIDFSSVYPYTSNTIGIWASSTGTTWNLLNADGGGNGIGSITIPQNTWTHIAFVRSGTTWMSFVNGVKDVNAAGVSGSIISRPTAPKVIGAWFSAGALGTTNGCIDDLRITKGYARYTANFTPPASQLLTK